MLKDAKVFDFFPATFDTVTEQVDLRSGCWQNGILFDMFKVAIGIFNLFYEMATGDHLQWKVRVED